MALVYGYTPLASSLPSPLAFSANPSKTPAVAFFFFFQIIPPVVWSLFVDF